MQRLNLNLEDSLKEEPDFYLFAHFDNDYRKRDVYIACIRICPIWSQLYNTPHGKNGVTKDDRFKYRRIGKENGA